VLTAKWPIKKKREKKRRPVVISKSGNQLTKYKHWHVFYHGDCSTGTVRLVGGHRSIYLYFAQCFCYCFVICNFSVCFRFSDCFRFRFSKFIIRVFTPSSSHFFKNINCYPEKLKTYCIRLIFETHCNIRGCNTWATTGGLKRL